MTDGVALLLLAMMKKGIKKKKFFYGRTRQEVADKIRKALKEEGLSTSKIKHIHTILNSALKQAVKSGLLPRNVSEAVTLPKSKKKETIKVLTLEEERRFLEALEGERLKPAFVLALTTTRLRLGDISAQVE